MKLDSVPDSRRFTRRTSGVGLFVAYSPDEAQRIPRNLRRRLHQIVEFAFHMQFRQLAETADTFSVNDDLRDGARALGHARKLAQCLLRGIDSNLLITDAPLIEQGFGLDADWTGAGAVYRYAGHDASFSGCDDRTIDEIISIAQATAH